MPYNMGYTNCIRNNMYLQIKEECSFVMGSIIIIIIINIIINYNL